MTRLPGALTPFTSLTAGGRVWGISRPPRRRGENLLGALETRARGGVTLVSSLSLSQRRRLKMAFGLEPGKLCSTGGSWTSLRSRGLTTHTARGRRRHMGLKASHSRAWQEAGQPCRSGTVPGCGVCCGSGIWQGQVRAVIAPQC